MKSNKLKLGIIGVLSAVTAATVLCACSNKSVKTYTVTFDTRGGSSVSSSNLEAGEQIRRPSTIPTKEMFIFDDWYTDTTYTQKFDFNISMPSYDITVYAGWIGLASVEVTFDANGGKFDDNATQYTTYGDVGATFTSPTKQPTNEGYAFGGWYIDPDCTNAYTFSVYPVDNLTLYAGWANDSNYAYVSYYGNGSLIAKLPVKKGERILEPLLFDDDIIVNGWYTNEAMTDKYEFGSNAKNNLSLYSSYYTDGLVISNGKVTAYTGNATQVIVPEKYNGSSVTEIGQYAFYSSTELARITSISLPSTVTTISEGAFYDCQYLVGVNLTDKVTSIGKNAFYNNARLKTVGDISAVTTVGEAAFIGCKALSKIELPTTLTAIGEYAFTDCTMLTEVVIPTGVKQISDYMFSGCTSLKRVEINAQLPVINAHVFERCSALKQVVIKSTIVATLNGSGNKVSPFTSCANVTISVPAASVEAYVQEYGQYDNGTLGEKFKAI